MLLAIDVGNTNCKFSIHGPTGFITEFRCATEHSRTADDYAAWLSQLMALRQIDFDGLKHCIISTVVPQAVFNLRNLGRRYLDVEPMVVGEDVKLGIDVRVDNPDGVGADRLVNAIGAFVAHGGPAIVIDSGTATTFDIVGADGGFEGGIITPGINLSVQALHMAAAKLPRIEIRRPDRVIGTNTVGAMQAGIFWGYIELVDGLVERIKVEYGRPMTVVATGGVASLFEGASRTIDIYDTEVTSRGLLELFRRNGGVICPGS
jgi:type III pantothenate kinase